MVKLKPDKLSSIVLSKFGIFDENIVVGAKLYEDAAVVKTPSSKYLIVHTDPITGAIEYIGWLSIHIPANDVVVEGGIPKWYLITILLPENFPDNELLKITNQIDYALKELNCTLIGGHTEYTPSLNHVITVSTCIGVSDGYISTGGAKIGDYVIMTKGVALEATSILASDFENELIKKGVPGSIIKKAKEFVRETSLVKEALAIRDLVNSMHDPTEGGLLQGLLEIAYASNVGIEIWLENVIIREETEIIHEVLGLNPLKSLSSGTLLATVPEDNISEVEKRLKSLGIEYSIIGRVIASDEPKVIVLRNGKIVEVIKEQIDDEIMLLWSRQETTKCK